LQYFAYPDGRYEAGANIGPDEWLRLKLNVVDRHVKAWINGAEVLSIEESKIEAACGDIGLWVDIGTGAYFSDLPLSRSKRRSTSIANYKSPEAPDRHTSGANLVRRWPMRDALGATNSSRMTSSSGMRASAGRAKTDWRPSTPSDTSGIPCIRCLTETFDFQRFVHEGT
jgi:hypothetical protein